MLFLFRPTLVHSNDVTAFTLLKTTLMWFTMFNNTHTLLLCCEIVAITTKVGPTIAFVTAGSTRCRRDWQPSGPSSPEGGRRIRHIEYRLNPSRVKCRRLHVCLFCHEIRYMASIVKDKMLSNRGFRVISRPFSIPTKRYTFEVGVRWRCNHALHSFFRKRQRNSVIFNKVKTFSWKMDRIVIDNYP